jgi:hypothetical protein
VAITPTPDRKPDYTQSVSYVGGTGNGGDLRKELILMLSGLETLLTAKLDAATLLFNETLAHARDQFMAADALLQERHLDLVEQLKERNVRRAEDRHVAEASLLAQVVSLKEAIQAVKESSDKAASKLETAIVNSREVSTTEVGALKERLDRGEGNQTGAQRSRENNTMTIGNVSAIVGIAIAAVVLTTTLVPLMLHFQGTSGPTAETNSRRSDEIENSLARLSNRLNALTPALKTP